jgi:hypothetical protein
MCATMYVLELEPQTLACKFLLASVVDTLCTPRYTRRPRAHQRFRL